MNDKVLCGFHAHCDDGFAAAWAVRHGLGDDRVEFFGGVYGKAPPDVTGRDVVLVDFSYKRPVLDEMIAKATTLLVLDHHKTAAEDLSGLPPAGIDFQEWMNKGPRATVGVLFDMNRSGAGIAWDFFHGRTPHATRPEFIDYVEDRDLWKKELPEGDQFTIALRSYPQDFQTWDALIARGVPALIQEGRPLWRYYRARIDEMKRSAYLARIRYPEKLGYFHCGIANAPYFAASELAGELAEMEGAQFGACYFEVRPGEWQYSLRSRSDFDVSEVAKLFGGGGHKGAAGFTVNEPVHHTLQNLTDNEMASAPRGIL